MDYLKKTKRGGQLDIKPAVQSIEPAPDAEEKVREVVHAVAPAQEPTLNPELLARHWCRKRRRSLRRF